METDNEKVIELQYRLNYFPSLNKLINIVQQRSPEITKAEIKLFHEKHITTQLTKEQREEQSQGHIVAYYLNEVWASLIWLDINTSTKIIDIYWLVLMSLVVKRMLNQRLIEMAFQSGKRLSR